MQEVIEALGEIRVAITELRSGQDELRSGQNEMRASIVELRSGQDEMRASIVELRTGQAELRHELRDQSAVLGGLIESVRDDVRMIADGHLVLLERVEGVEARVELVTEDLATVKMSVSQLKRAAAKRGRGARPKR